MRGLLMHRLAQGSNRLRNTQANNSMAPPLTATVRFSYSRCSSAAKAQRVTRIGFCIIKHELQVAVFWNRPLLQGLSFLDMATPLPFNASSARTRLREALLAERPPRSVGEGSNPKPILRLSWRIYQ